MGLAPAAGRPSSVLTRNLDMAKHSRTHFDLEMIDGVAVAYVTSPEIRHPAPAQELGAELAELVDRDRLTRLVVDLSDTRYISSTGFAVLLSFAKKVQAAKGELKLAGLQPDVMVGANIIGLGRVVEIHPNVDSALASF
jgi:anti-sigma B factor antagonist